MVTVERRFIQIKWRRGFAIARVTLEDDSECRSGRDACADARLHVRIKTGMKTKGTHNLLSLGPIKEGTGLKPVRTKGRSERL